MSERAGVLAYSVEPIEGQSLERPLFWGVLAAVAGLALGVLAAWFALGVVADRRLVTAAAAFAPPVAGLAGAWLTARGAAPDRRRRAYAVVAAVSLAGTLASWATVRSYRPALPQLRAAVSASELPSGYHVERTEVLGDRLCHTGCPEVRLFVRTPAVEDPGRVVVRALLARGWEPADTNIPPDLNTVLYDGQLTVDVTQTATTEVRLTVSTTTYVT